MSNFLTLSAPEQFMWLLCGGLAILGLLSVVWRTPRRPDRRREVICARPDPKARRVQTTTQHWWA